LIVSNFYLILQWLLKHCLCKKRKRKREEREKEKREKREQKREKERKKYCLQDINKTPIF
jgi:hypothetical protein